MSVFSIRWGLVIAVALVATLVWALGLVPVVWWVVAGVWSVAPAPMTVLYLAALVGFLAITVYPRYRPGVAWSEVLTGRIPRRGEADNAVVTYLAAVRDDQDRTA